jgi:hypothetical protein
LNVTHKLLAYADVNVLGENTDTIQKKTKALLDANKEVSKWHMPNGMPDMPFKISRTNR